MIHLMDHEEDRPKVKDRTHRIDGPKREQDTSYSSSKPKGGCHVARSHAEVESAKIGDADLEDGVAFRMGMGNMDHAIEDGKNGYED